ncbi:hypothetical protein BSKO_01826 [Bryopsis sp. KO-2023]|nr:hypothetical protein BSKO_01826 [Bryopsis sp. KO-2023]
MSQESSAKKAQDTHTPNGVSRSNFLEGSSNENTPTPTGVVDLLQDAFSQRRPPANKEPTAGCSTQRTRKHSEVEFWLEASANRKMDTEAEVNGAMCFKKVDNLEFSGKSEKIDTISTGPAMSELNLNGSAKQPKHERDAYASIYSEDSTGMDPPIRPSPRKSASPKTPLLEHAEDDILEQKLLEEAQKHKSQTFTRFSLSDIADNPDLAKAAKLELTGKSEDGDAVSVVESIGDAASRITDLERVRFTADSADRDAGRESQAGMEEVDLLVKRLELGKKSVNNMLKLVMKLHQVEIGYSRSLIAVARMAVPNIGSSEGCKVAADGMAELPMVVGGAHSVISQTLVECETKLRSAMNKIKVVSDELSLQSQKVHGILTNKRGALTRAISGHEQACKVSPDEPNAPPSTGLDPWLTEGKLAQGHTQLLEAQFTLRSFLASAFGHVRDVETHRLQVAKQVMSSLMKCYGASVEGTIVPYTTNLEKVIGVVDIDQEILDLSQTADAHATAAKGMEVMHVEEETLRCGDLFSSPDIIRQGSLEVRETGSMNWSTGHFVLTQSGFVYWFLGARAGAIPSDSINLGKSSFAGGDAPEFKIVEGSGMGLFGTKRTMVFKAPSVEDCCEWAISIRETLAEVKSRRSKKPAKGRRGFGVPRSTTPSF